MGLQEFDLCIANLKKSANTLKNKEKDEDEVEKQKIHLENVKYELQKVSEFTLKEQVFLNDLFTMVLPDGLFHEPLVEGHSALYQSLKEYMTLVVKMIETEKAIDPERLRTDYSYQMKQSKQQTKIDISEVCETDSGTVYYFTAIHSMPGEGQCDFIILFKIQEKMVIMDFGFRQSEYSFWKTVIQNLIPTINFGKGA